MPSSPETDPDALALLYVQQWLTEAGHTAALKALEKEAGLIYDEDKLTGGSQLMHLVWAQIEAQLSAEHADDDGAAAEREEEEAMLRSGLDDYAVKPCGSVPQEAQPGGLPATWVPSGFTSIKVRLRLGLARLVFRLGPVRASQVEQ
ncbi:hypothetical protein FOA52_002389 [Chlamydomonas sp. UWO 241]|nr:hypothetical protein FOA52_002389 [Chlamydomonas sp. UWO 241]